MLLFHLKTNTFIALTSLVLLYSSQIHAQQYYKWVDANGSTHYTRTPPPKGTKLLDKVSTYGVNSNQNKTNTPTPDEQKTPQHNTSSPTNPPQPDNMHKDETLQPQNTEIVEAPADQ
ncbi:DUF4124 domain-containing protein [Acinetobacter suaedae]|uniref:DUF4124 domain-containing protein n=1 Tax=Acinetobacter suaedae TaxID=2609668 RepID=A0A5P1UXL2_9GAMM|nr:DUF4124 domain-containing protein [Acinetobacter sp. C16S1]QER40560.1 DUF4124 domain-containing protein [Acinetobacter sp. C16S1]